MEVNRVAKMFCFAVLLYFKVIHFKYNQGSKLPNHNIPLPDNEGMAHKIIEKLEFENLY